ncbi:MAG: restriction endonuclease subunit S [Gammaproteobacteria bacterium]
MDNVKLVPELRFPGFDDDWKKVNLSKVFNITAGGDIKKSHVSHIKTSEFPYPIYANAEKAKGLYGFSNIFKVNENVITVTGRGVNIGIAHARDHKFYPIVRLLILKPKHDIDIVFFEYLINQINLFIESTGVPQLTAPQLSTYSVNEPTLREQQKIANFLTAVDKRIGLLKQKKTALETYKKGLMQKIFNQEIRFKPDSNSPLSRGVRGVSTGVCSIQNSNNYPDWEEKSFISSFPVVTNGFVGTATPHYRETGICYIQGKNIKKNSINNKGMIFINDEFHTKQKNSQLKENDILMVQSGHVGECAVVSKDYEDSNCHALQLLNQ